MTFFSIWTMFVDRRSQALQTLLIVHQALVCILIILRLLIRLKDSCTAPKDVLQEFADLAEEKNVRDPFAETKSQRQIASQIMRLLLRIKNGTPPVCKTALRQITDKA
jgi:hypothetical protein